MKMFVNVSRTRQNARKDYREDCATLTFDFISLTKNISNHCKVKQTHPKYPYWCFLIIYSVLYHYICLEVF